MIRRMAAAALMSVLLLTLPHLASPATAGPVQTAGVCYDGAVVGYVTGAPTAYLPSATGYYRTTSRCADINFSNRSSSGAVFHSLIRVCFVSAGYCQSSWKEYKWAPGVDWMVIASNVRDGTTFRLEFLFYETSWNYRYGNLIAF